MIPVADAVYDDGNNLFVYREEFAECKLDLTRIETEESGAPELAEELVAWVTENGLEGTEKKIDEEGKAFYEDLSLGLYLFIQKTAAEGYECVHPFLVTVPLWDGEKLVYDVDAGPKPGTAMGLVYIEPPVKKIFKANKGTLPKDETFTFRMIPAEKDQPMPAPEGSVKNEENGAITITHGAGTFSFGKIWFSSEDVGKTYAYRIGEVAGKNSKITYDKTIYTMKIEVIRNEENGKIECKMTITGSDDKEASEIVFTNVYETPPTPGTPGKPGKPSLPKTGQLWWPVPILALAGILFFGFGRIRSRSNK
jgi:pilin isopeptide linkage protein